MANRYILSIVFTDTLADPMWFLILCQMVLILLFDIALTYINIVYYSFYLYLTIYINIIPHFNHKINRL